jgi:hypothetical protein
MHLAVVTKNSRSATERIDQQIQVTIPINVGQNSARRVLIPATDAGGIRDILKFPIPKIAVELVAPSVQAAKINITQAVTVHVSGCHPGSAEESSIPQQVFVVEQIGEKNSRVCAIEQRKACLSGPGRGEFSPPTIPA